MHVAAHGREDGSLVAGARPDLQDAAARRRVQQLCHERDHPGLADGLAIPDRYRLVRVREVAASFRDEPLARHCRHRGQDALVHDPACAELDADHRVACRLEPCRVGGPIHGPSIRRGWAGYPLGEGTGDGDGDGAALGFGVALGAADPVADGLAEPLGVDAEALAAGDPDAPGTTDPLGAADAGAVGGGACVPGTRDGIGFGLGSGVSSPPFPRTTALSTISTKTAMTPITKIAEARSSMWTAMSDAVCARWGTAGSRLPRAARPESRPSPRLAALSLPRRSMVEAAPFARWPFPRSPFAGSLAPPRRPPRPRRSRPRCPPHRARRPPAAARRRAPRRSASPPGARPARGRPAWSSCCVTPSMGTARRRRTPGPRIPQAGAER
jgi:hypothetical protein